MYAIVRASGRQEKVSVGDVVEMNRCVGAPGSSVTLPVVLLVDDDDVTHRPGDLAGAEVEGEIIDHGRGRKIYIGKFKNKTGYRRRQGHRQDMSTVKITAIRTGK